MKVKAREGVNVPKERASREYITAKAEVDVPDTAYYRRRIADGDLLRVEEQEASAAVDAGNKKSTKGV